MLSIRLSRIGKKKRASFRLLVTEKTRDPWGKYLELLGTYDPLLKKVDFNIDRIKYWISKGAQPTPTVLNMMIERKMIEGTKVKAHPTHKAVVESK